MPISNNNEEPSLEEPNHEEEEMVSSPPPIHSNHEPHSLTDGGDEDGLAPPSHSASMAEEPPLEDCPPRPEAPAATPMAALPSSQPSLVPKTSDSPKQQQQPALNRELYRIPSYAGWFSWGKIHTIERRAFSEFFDGRSISKTPKIYREYRDFMINKFRENPRRPLTFTEVRKMLVGDVNCIRRVFDFLEYWGLINYHVSSDPKQQQQQVKMETPSPVVTDTLPSTVRVHPGIATGFFLAGTSVAVSDNLSGSLPTVNLATYKDAFTSTSTDTLKDIPENAEKLVKTVCSVCGTDCTNHQFECSKQAGHVICSNCYTSSNYGVGLSAEDFIEKDANSNLPTVAENWTEQETLLLLEAVMQYGEDWNLVSNHVRTKSKAQCIMRFIQLPFGDQFLVNEAADSPSTTQLQGNPSGDEVTVVEQRGSSMVGDSLEQRSAGNHIGEDTLDSNEDVAGPYPKRMRLSPLADASNPIMAQVAFLSAMVGPRVAAAAAQAAVAALAEEDPTALQIVGTNTQTGHKDILLSGHQTASGKEFSEKEEPQCAKGGTEQVQPLKEVEPEYANAAVLKDSVPSITHIRAGIAVALAAVAANAKLVADQEEREIEHLMADIIENQLNKLQSKIEHFEELELLLEREHLQIEQTRAQILADRIKYAQLHFKTRP